MDVSERLCGDVEVTKHGVAAPFSNKSDDVAVDAAKEKSHRAAGMERFGRDFFGLEPHLRANVFNTGANFGGKVFALDNSPFTSIVVAGDGDVCGGASAS